MFNQCTQTKRNPFNCEGGAQRGVCGASTSKDELRHHGLCEDCNRSVTDIDDVQQYDQLLNHGPKDRKTPGKVANMLELHT